MITHPSPLRALLLILLLGLPFGSVSCSKKDTVETRPDYNNPIIAHLKLPAPKVLGEKVNLLATELDPTGQAAMMLPMFLQAYGYPNFDGISATDPVTMFILGEATSDEPGLVLMVKASQDSALVAQAKNIPDLQIRPSGEWLMMSQSAQHLAMVTDEGELARLAAEPGTHDIQLAVLPDGLIELRPKIVESMEKDLAEDETVSEAAKPWIRGFVNLGLDELEATRSMVTGININAQAISFALEIDALGGTPLGDVLSQDTAGRVSGGEYIPTGYSIGGVFDYDPEATVAYWNYLLDKVAAFAPAEFREQVVEVRDIMADYTLATSGIGGSAFDILEMQAQSVQWLEGDLEAEQVHRVYEYISEEFMPVIMEMAMADVAAETGSDVEFSAGYQRDVGEVAGLAYHVYRQEFVFPDGSTGEVSEELKGLRKQAYYVAIHDGDLLITTSLDQLDTLARAAQDGSPVPENIASMFQPKPGLVGQLYLDLISYYENILLSMPADTGLTGNPRVMAIFSMLREADLPPLRYEFFADDNRGGASFALPMSTLKTAVETIYQSTAGGAGNAQPGM